MSRPISDEQAWGVPGDGERIDSLEQSHQSTVMEKAVELILRAETADELLDVQDTLTWLENNGASYETARWYWEYWVAKYARLA